MDAARRHAPSAPRPATPSSSSCARPCPISRRCSRCRRPPSRAAASAPQAYVGSGPFRVETYDPAKRLLRLRAFDDHFAGRPYLDQLELRWHDTPDGEARRFEGGASQISARGVGAFATSVPLYRAREVEGPAALLLYLGFGAAHPEITRSPELPRRARSRARPRSAPLRQHSASASRPRTSPCPPRPAARRPARPPGAAICRAAQGALAAAARAVRALDPAARGQLELEILIEDTRPDDRELASYVVYALHGLGLRAKVTALPAREAPRASRRARPTCGSASSRCPSASAPLWWAAAFAAGGDLAAATAAAAGALGAAAARQQFEQRLPILPLLFRSVRPVAPHRRARPPARRRRAARLRRRVPPRPARAVAAMSARGPLP